MGLANVEREVGMGVLIWWVIIRSWEIMGWRLLSFIHGDGIVIVESNSMVGL